MEVLFTKGNELEKFQSSLRQSTLLRCIWTESRDRSVRSVSAQFLTYWLWSAGDKDWDSDSNMATGVTCWWIVGVGWAFLMWGSGDYLMRSWFLDEWALSCSHNEDVGLLDILWFGWAALYVSCMRFALSFGSAFSTGQTHRDSCIGGAGTVCLFFMVVHRRLFIEEHVLQSVVRNAWHLHIKTRFQASAFCKKTFCTFLLILACNACTVPLPLNISRPFAVNPCSTELLCKFLMHSLLLANACFFVQLHRAQSKCGYLWFWTW